jgi:hypothetical protein
MTMNGFEFFIERYGTLAGLTIYILIRDVIPFLRDIFWPEMVKERTDLRLERRQYDENVLDLRERNVVAVEQIGKTLILNSERLSKLEAEAKLHDDRTLALFSQLTGTLAATQTTINVILDRTSRAKTTGSV